MQCIAHTWNSIDCEGYHFLLCLSPLNSVEGGAPIEAFSNEKSLARRLAEVGLCAISIAQNMSDLRSRKDTTWHNVEVTQEIFEAFGQRPERRLLRSG
jgi:hypothetical protein